MKTEKSPRPWIIATLITALAGIVNLAVLAAQHYRIAEQGLMQKSFCTLSNLIDCDTVLSSSYSRIGPMLNSEIGILFYLIVIGMALWALASQERQRSAFSFILLASTTALTYSIYMASILINVLHVICMFCIASYLLTLVIFCFALKLSQVKLWKFPSFIVSYIRRSLSPPQEKSERTHLFQYLGVSAILFGIGTLFFFGLNKEAHTLEPEFNQANLLRYFYEQEAFDLDISNRPFSGPAEAPITIVDFSDFQCPFCRRAAFSLKPYLGEFRSRVKIVYLHYPLASICNPSIPHAGHPQACTAAKAALCVYKKKGNDAFWEFHDLSFENQQRLSHHLITTTLAPQVGITAEEMGRCIISSEIEGELAQDVEQGQQAKVEGTPAIFINGRYLRGWVYPSILRTVIEAELKRVTEKRIH